MTRKFESLDSKKSQKDKKNSFLKETVENADLHKAVLNKKNDHTRILRVIRFRSFFNQKIIVCFFRLVVLF